ncbi:general secretion pathway protein GspB [Massilia sp. METH4]|uniref:general secretion pathway protein GspB n=1 Tax=Massilia sp. METH4 TaxID=3123041 RepID=UPI0030D3D6B4
MSYILEALKKAQAERQLGETPGIHTPVPQAPAGGAAPLRKPLAAAFAVMALAIVGLAAVIWRQATAPAQPPVVPVAAVPAAQVPLTQTAPGHSGQAPVVQAVPVQSAQVPVAQAVPMQSAQAPVAHAVPMQSAQLPVAQAVPAQSAQVAVTPARRAPPVSQPAAAAAASATALAAASTPPPAVQPVHAGSPVAGVNPPPLRGEGARAAKKEEPAGEEHVQALRDLPEPIQRAIPPISMSGYMYSPNPADRLVLIDKVLRREGDEVAPGLVLVRLEPKGAVFTFRGYRYRMPY